MFPKSMSLPFSLINFPFRLEGWVLPTAQETSGRRLQNVIWDETLPLRTAPSFKFLKMKCDNVFVCLNHFMPLPVAVTCNASLWRRKDFLTLVAVITHSPHKVLPPDPLWLLSAPAESICLLRPGFKPLVIHWARLACLPPHLQKAPWGQDLGTGVEYGTCPSLQLRSPWAQWMLYNRLMSQPRRSQLLKAKPSLCD